MPIPFIKAWREQRAANAAAEKQAAEAKENALRDLLYAHLDKQADEHRAIGFKVAGIKTHNLNQARAHITAVAPNGQAYCLSVNAKGGHWLTAL